MALYIYQAYSKEGKKIKGTLDAGTEEAVRESLIKNGIYPFSIVIAQDLAGQISWYRRIFQGAVTLKDKILLTKQLAVLLKAGVPLLQAIELLIEQFQGRMRSILINIRDGIKEGRSFTEGLAKFPKVFDTIYVQLVRAGEASGKLESILERLVEYMERRAAIVKKIKGALSYPMIQLGIVVLVVIGLLTFVVPQIAGTFQSQGQTLPGTTRVLIAVSDALRNHYLLILGVLGVITALFMYWKSTAQGSKALDVIMLKIPIVGYFTRMGAIVQFSRTLGLLIESGVNLSEALDIVVKITTNRILKNALNEARDKIIKQGKIAEFLEQTKIFPPIAIYLIKTGEETGQLDQMLLRVASNYENDLLEYSDSLTSKLEPIMLIVMGVVVGFVVLSIVQPMLKQAEMFK